MTDRERVAVTVIGTNLVMDYGTNERAVAAMDALAAGVTLSPSLDEGLDVAAARWAAQAYRVCGVDRRQTDALIKAGLLYPSLDEGLREERFGDDVMAALRLRLIRGATDATYTPREVAEMVSHVIEKQVRRLAQEGETARASPPSHDRSARYVCRSRHRPR